MSLLNNNERRATTGIALRWSQLLAIVIFNLLSWGALYGVMRANTDENARRIHDLEQKTFVTREEYEARQRELTDRLKRIEAQLDELVRRRR